MKLFDSHSHIDDTCFEKDFDQMLKRAHDLSVHGIMVVGINEKTSKKAIELAKNHKNLITSVGVHPHDAETCSDDVIKKLETLALTHQCVRAWGETGLDFNRMHSPKNVQERWFETQIYAASKLNLPMIFHERDSDGLRSRRAEFARGLRHRHGGAQRCARSDHPLPERAQPVQPGDAHSIQPPEKDARRADGVRRRGPRGESRAAGADRLHPLLRIHPR